MGTLAIHWQYDGPRYYLDGEPVHAGDIIEARTYDGQWTVARFEYAWDAESGEVEPFFIVPTPDGGHRLLEADLECRWPDLAYARV